MDQNPTIVIMPLMLPAPKRAPVFLLPAPQIAGLLPASVDTPGVALRLVYPQRTVRARKAGIAHLAVTGAFRQGNLKRAAGDPLCKPASEWPGMLDFVPPGVEVCPKCAEIAERYDLPLPDGIEAAVPSTFVPRPGVDVTYKERSKWFNYHYGFPFEGHLRTWKWLVNNAVCGQCGAHVSLYDSQEPVLGQPSARYRKCHNGHLLKDGRDLGWKKIPREKDGTQVRQGYSWLVAASEEVPF